jgi:hypothetical protein
MESHFKDGSKHTLAKRSSLIHGTKYFQGHISSVLTPRVFFNRRVVIDFADVKFGCTRNLAATSTENSYVLNTRSTGFRRIVTTEVLSFGSLEVKL